MARPRGRDGRADLGYVGGTLVVPQSVLVRAYWTELRDGLAKSGIPLRHFVLHADPLTLAARIDNDPEGTGIRRWRHDHVAPYADALPWLREEAEIVETADVAPHEVARRIAAAVTAQGVSVKPPLAGSAWHARPPRRRNTRIAPL